MLFPLDFTTEFQKQAVWLCTSCHSNITDHCFRDNKRIENKMSLKIVARFSASNTDESSSAPNDKTTLHVFGISSNGTNNDWKHFSSDFIKRFESVIHLDDTHFWWIKSIHSYGSFNHEYFSFSQQWYLKQFFCIVSWLVWVKRILIHFICLLINSIWPPIYKSGFFCSCALRKIFFLWRSSECERI